MSNEFLACDWGTTHLRVQCFDRRRGQVVAELHTGDGAARLAAGSTGQRRAQTFAETLDRRIAELSKQMDRSLAGLPIVISGMASSSIGWQELPYAQVPLSLDGSGLVWHKLAFSTNDTLSQEMSQIVLVSGACSDRDVMRGEEMQIVGLAELGRREPDRFVLPEIATVVLPGTHSKHIDLADGMLRGFRTFMTGELYALLAKHSVLQHSLASGELTMQTPQTQTSFAAGVEQGAHHGLAASLFGVRTRQLLQGTPPAENARYLSGLLIGDELAHLLAGPAADRPILLAAAGELAGAYHHALQLLGAGDRTIVLGADDVARLSALGQSRLFDLIVAAH